MNFSRPSARRSMPSFFSCRSTTICVAMPAWSVPGTQRTRCPRMRFQRARMSSIVRPYACPIWRRPVTFGGGMTMTNRGADGDPAGWKRPSFSQRAYQPSSKWAGSKVFSRTRTGAGAESAVFDMKKGLSGSPFIYQMLRAFYSRPVLFHARLELLDALLDDDLGDVGDDLPGDLADDALGQALDDARGQAVDLVVGEAAALGAGHGREHFLELADRRRGRELLDLGRNCALGRGRRRCREAEWTAFAQAGGLVARRLRTARLRRIGVAIGGRLGPPRERGVFRRERDLLRGRLVGAPRLGRRNPGATPAVVRNRRRRRLQGIG